MSINLRDPKTQKWLLVTIMLFGLTYAYANFVYIPRHDLTNRLVHDIKKESDLLKKGKRIAANYQTVQEDYARLMESWNIAQELLPTRREMEGLLKSITLAGKKRDVNFLLFRPLDPVEKPYYWENPIQIRTLSDYHDLGRFMSAVASLDRIVNIKDIKLSSFKPKKGRSPYTVEADFVATIYVFKELGAPVGVQEPEDNKKPGRRGA